jgi:hypothetical protein
LPGGFQGLPEEFAFNLVAPVVHGNHVSERMGNPSVDGLPTGGHKRHPYIIAGASGRHSLCLNWRTGQPDDYRVSSEVTPHPACSGW